MMSIEDILSGVVAVSAWHCSAAIFLALMPGVRQDHALEYSVSQAGC